MLCATTARAFWTPQLPKVVRSCQALINNFDFRNVLRATTLCIFLTSQLPKVLRTWGVLYMFPWKCSSPHNGVPIFNISTSKSAPRPSVFNTFDFDMCPARHNSIHFFYISTSKSAPNMRCFFTFWLWNLLRATTACNCSLLISPDGSAPAAFAILLFDPLEPQNIGKNIVHLLSSSFSSLIFFLLLFSSLTLPTFAFPSVRVVGSLTSKLPPIL